MARNLTCVPSSAVCSRRWEGARYVTVWLIIEVPGCVLLLRDVEYYSSRFHLVVFNAIALVVQDIRTKGLQK